MSCSRQMQPAELQFIRDRYELDGATAIAKQLGRNITTVVKRARAMGLRATQNQVQGWVTRKQNNPILNERAFEFLNEDTAYCFGWIWSDGNIYKAPGTNYDRIGIEVQEQDLIVLEHIKKVIGYTGNIHRYQRDRPCQATVVLRTSSNLMAQDLKNLGICYRKSFVNPPFPNVPDSLLGPFTRGVIDGDGSVEVLPGGNRIRINIFGSQQFLQTLSERLAAKCQIKQATVEPSGTCFKIRWAAATDCLRLIQLLYPTQSEFGLPRKKSVMLNWFTRRQ